MEVRPCDAPIGAEVFAIDLSEPLEQKTFDQVVDVFHKHSVLVFRDQKLTSAQQIAFSSRFGRLDVNVRSQFNKPGFPPVLVVSNILDNGKPVGVQDAGRYWHTDLCYRKAPSRATFLHALEVPSFEDMSLGDTMFTSTALAYDKLSDAMKKRLQDLTAVFSYDYTYHKKAQEFNVRRSLKGGENEWIPDDVVHPVVRPHPYTGRKCLYVNEGYTTRINELPEDESERLLRFLFNHVTRPEFIYRHRWRRGDLLMWDNASTQHKVIVDYALPARRMMERTTVLVEQAT